MVKKEVSSDNNCREAYLQIAFWSATSSHRVPPFPSWKSLLTLLSYALQGGIRELNEGYGETGNISRKLERSLLRKCISMCKFNSQSYTFLFSVQFANTVFWKSALGYLWMQWSLRWQRKYRHMKTRKKFVRKVLVMCEFISQSYTYVSSNSRLPLFWGTWEGILWIALRPTLINKISSVQNVKEAFWETSLWCLNSTHRGTA